MSSDDFQQSPFGKPTPWDDENPFRDNPYATPDAQGGLGGPMPHYPPSARRGMVRHVPIVAVLMMVQGGLEVVMGLVLIGMGTVMPMMMKSMNEQMAQQGAPPGGPTPEMMSWIFLAMYGGMGLVVLAGACLHIVAGIRNYAFRGRVLGIVALIAGMATTVLTCYCAPTAVALGVYGLICYLNPEVAYAFSLIRSGKTKQEILNTLA